MRETWLTNKRQGLEQSEIDVIKLIIEGDYLRRIKLTVLWLDHTWSIGYNSEGHDLR